MPDSYPEWPKRPTGSTPTSPTMRAATGSDRLMRFNTAVVAMDRRADRKPGWSLELATPNGTSREDFDFVAICTGQFNEPQTL